jgi:hypothetical protein
MSVNDPKRTLESGQFYTDFYRARAHAVADRTVSSKRPGFQFNLSAGTRLGVRNLAPKHVGRKDTSCSYLESCKESR